MLFFGKKPPPRAKAKDTPPGFTVGSLFNPNIGATLRPLGETGKMLVSIVALLFAAHGLFPRNHPALLGVTGAQLTLGEVITTGWRNLKFNPEKPLPALIFFAVLLSLGCSVLAVIAGLMSVFVGTAHAQTPPTGAAMFAQNNSQDIACGWLNWLFGTTTYNCSLWDYLPNGQNVSNLQSTSIQTAFIGVLGFYSDVILVIAAVVLFYHLASMIVETAHHGVAMGRRANQVWAPIRLVFAVGLLVPISGGLNAGQYIVLQVAQWGSAVASNAWGYFLQEMVDNANNIPFVAPMAPEGRKVVSDLVLMEACAVAYNAVAGTGQDALQIPLTPTGVTENGVTKYSFTPTSADSTVNQQEDQNLCGYYIVNARPSDTLGGSIYDAHVSAFNSALTDATAFATQNIVYAIPNAYNSNTGSAVNGQAGSPWPPNDSFEPLVYNYAGYMQSNFTGVANSLGQTMATVAQSSLLYGWVGAGAWFNTIARVQGDIADLSQNIPIKTTPPQVAKVVATNKELKESSIDSTVSEIMKNFRNWLANEVSSGAAGTPGAGLTAQQQQLLVAESGMMQDNGDGNTHIMDSIFEAVDLAASKNGVWQPAVTADNCGGNASACFTMGVQFISSDPLAEIASFGHANLNTAYQLFDEYMILLGTSAGLKDIAAGAGAFSNTPLVSLLAKTISGTSSLGGSATEAIGTVVGTITVVFFTAGFMLAFFLPLIPFYRFMFGTLSWFLSCCECTIAIPLVALAHLTPEGEGFMGDKAKGAYYFVFNIFLRPTLMVFGLICGFLMFDLGASLMNLLYATAVASAGGISNGHYTLARLVYSVIYVVILYLMCNKCFQLIDFLPDHAIKWMGAQGLQHAQMGDPMEVAGTMGLASGYVDQKIVSGAGQFMSGPAGAIALGAAAAPDSKFSPAIKGGLADLSKTATAAGLPQAGTALTGAVEKAGAIAQGSKDFVGAYNKERGNPNTSVGEALSKAWDSVGQDGKPSKTPPESGGNQAGSQNGNQSPDKK